MKKEVLKVTGMSCANCELKIESTLEKIPEVTHVKASYSHEQVEVEYDDFKISSDYIKMKIAVLGYQVVDEKEKNKQSKNSISDVILDLLIIVLIYMMLNQAGLLEIFNVFPSVDSSMSYGVLFLVGVMSSIHCVSMCGGINLAQSVHALKKDSSKKANLWSNFQYNLGRVISYTIVGGIVGGIGSVVSFNGYMTGIVAIIGGIFMVIMGLNMLNVFPSLKKFNVKMPKFITKKLGAKKNKSSFYVGLLNGLMPCGPLQSMQIYALSTASIVGGALAMFFFSVGTVPLMFLLGAISSYLNKKFMKGMMYISACLVILLGFNMFTSGTAQSGIYLPFIGGTNLPVVEATVVEDLQTIKVELERNAYVPIQVQKDIPVSWTIHADASDLSGCNRTIVIPEYDLKIGLVAGDNLIEFTPTSTGTFTYSCWMGMVRSKIVVVA